MIEKSSLKFIADLKKHNNRDWFEKNRPSYEKARADVENCVGELINAIGSFYPGVSQWEAKKCMFRIYRDIRFSKDKTPYKGHMSACISPVGKRTNGPMYYFHFAPGDNMICGGIYMPEPDQLAAIRQEIDYNLAEFKKIIGSKTFKKYYPALDEEEGLLKKLPKGYDADNPAVKFLKYKSFTVSHSVPDKLLLSKGYTSYMKSAAKAMYPFIQFLTRAVEK
jgi:uncharacterized protein (TIGR02453 family)